MSTPSTGGVNKKIGFPVADPSRVRVMLVVSWALAAVIATALPTAVAAAPGAAMVNSAFSAQRSV